MGDLTEMQLTKEEKVIEYKMKKEEATSKRSANKQAMEKYRKEKEFLMPRYICNLYLF